MYLTIILGNWWKLPIGGIISYVMITNLVLNLCSEQSIAQSRASVMLYNNERKEWEHSGGSSGISRVHVYHHPVNNTYRIVGRKVQDHTVCEQVLEICKLPYRAVIKRRGPGISPGY